MKRISLIIAVASLFVGCESTPPASTGKLWAVTYTTEQNTEERLFVEDLAYGTYDDALAVYKQYTARDYEFAESVKKGCVVLWKKTANDTVWAAKKRYGNSCAK